MIRVVHAELRDSWPGWLGVSVAFVMTSFSLALSMMVLQSALAASGSVIPTDEATAYIATAGLNIVTCLVVGLNVVSASTGLVIDSRRGAVARLALAGATPRQVVFTVTGQLAVVAVASGLVGNLLAALVLKPTLVFLMHERADDSAGIPTPAVIDVATILGITAAWVLVVWLGGLRQARRASRIAPVEALRQSQGAEPSTRGVWRALRAGLAGLVLVGAFLGIAAMSADSGSDGFQTLMQLNLATLVVSGWLIAELLGWVLGPLTRGWTGLVARHSPAWWLARHTVLARTGRLVRSVLPVMFTIGLGFGLLTLPATYNATFRASGFDIELGHAGADSFLVSLGLPLGIALTGSVASLFMMSRQREGELALFGIAGATPAQRMGAATLEALIITVSAALLGIAMVVLTLVHLALGLGALGMTFGLELPLSALLVALVVTGGITVAATLLPTLPGQRRPEPTLVARLIAE